MFLPTLYDFQSAVAQRPAQGTIFLEGPAGAGKTTTGVARLRHLLATGAPGRSILVIVPQRTLASPYQRALRSADTPPGEEVTILTLGGLAQRMVELVWPLVAQPAGFAHPERPPQFLTLETAQYFMARLVTPRLEQGAFESITIDRNRLFSQILDNLNKAAVVGFPHTEIGPRLQAAWQGEAAQRRVYEEAQECASAFRQYCLEHNLLDFSLQVELFVQRLWPQPLVRDYLLTRYRHLIVDNCEEDTPIAHDILAEWLRHCQSALVIYDRDGGYRRFLGADPEQAATLGSLCQERVRFDRSLVASADLQALAYHLSRSLNRSAPAAEGSALAALETTTHRFYPQMLDAVAERIARLVHEEGTPPGAIAVLSPFLGDALRFALSNRLERLGVPTRSHRPSRALREEPATRCLLTLAALAHPGWRLCPTPPDVTYALMQAIAGMDLARAHLLTEIVYRVKERTPTLTTFAQIQPEVQERLMFVLGERYERLRAWLHEYQVGPPAELDHFLSRLFGEVLSQPGFGFHNRFDASDVAARLIESARKFRWATSNQPPPTGQSLGQEYIAMVESGVVAAQYVSSWEAEVADAVLLAPAYTFLMSNRAVDYQFWLNVGSQGWWERLYQPLTHPYVLSRRWPVGRIWSDGDEYEARQDALHRLVVGLLRRCRRKVILSFSVLSEQGQEQQGPLLQALWRMVRHLPQEVEHV